MNQKRKGINAERELIHKFWATDSWVACRVAGSGAIRYPAPDVLASNATRRLAIECKSTGDVRQYFDKRQIDDLRTFCNRSGAEAWIAVRFTGGLWYFISLEELNETECQFGISQKEAELKGLSFEQLIGIFEEEKVVVDAE